MSLFFSRNIKLLIASRQGKSQLRRFAIVPLGILFRLVLGSGSEVMVLGSCGVIVTLIAGSGDIHGGDSILVCAFI